MDTAKLDSHRHEYLIHIFEEGKVLPPKIKGIEDITERFPVFRSLTRASDTRDINCKVSSNDIGFVNLWKKVEEAKGKKVPGLMRHHYAEFSCLVEPC